MQAALEAGEHKKFFEIWNEVIPQHVRLAEGHKIEFYINLSLNNRYGEEKGMKKRKEKEMEGRKENRT